MNWKVGRKIALIGCLAAFLALCIAPRETLASNMTCDMERKRTLLTQALWHESRGEDIHGLFMTIQTIYNRKEHERYPNTICGVITQPSRVWYKPWKCAYSWWCDGRSDKIVVKNAIDENKLKLINSIVDGYTKGVYSYITDATMYHKVGITPDWNWSVLDFDRVVGKHRFYIELN